MIWDWPALRHSDALPETLAYERAVWGKLRGTLDDFGWIARSQDFDRDQLGIASRLRLGSEDELSQRASFWLNAGSCTFAVSSTSRLRRKTLSGTRKCSMNGGLPVKRISSACESSFLARQIRRAFVCSVHHAR